MLILIQKDNTIQFDMSSTDCVLELNFDGIFERYTRYMGTYEFIPKNYQQQIETENKVLEDNVICHEVPYTEVSNLYGKTVTIGG